LFNDLVDFGDLCPAKSSAPLQPDRVKPKLGNLIITFNMNMERFILIPCIKEKTIWPDS